MPTMERDVMTAVTAQRMTSVMARVPAQERPTVVLPQRPARQVGVKTEAVV